MIYHCGKENADPIRGAPDLLNGWFWLQMYVQYITKVAIFSAGSQVKWASIHSQNLLYCNKH